MLQATIDSSPTQEYKEEATFNYTYNMWYCGLLPFYREVNCELAALRCMQHSINEVLKMDEWKGGFLQVRKSSLFWFTGQMSITCAIIKISPLTTKGIYKIKYLQNVLAAAGRRVIYMQGLIWHGLLV